MLTFAFLTGEWDHVVYFPARLSDAGLETIPPDSEWAAALEAREGEDAGEVMARFNDLIAEIEVQIARIMR